LFLLFYGDHYNPSRPLSSSILALKWWVLMMAKMRGLEFSEDGKRTMIVVVQWCIDDDQNGQW